MNTWTDQGVILPVCGNLVVNGHNIPILDLKELPDKPRTDSGEEENHEVSGQR